MYKHTIMYVGLFMVCKRFLNAFKKKSKTISSSIGGLKLNKSLRLYVKIIQYSQKSNMEQRQEAAMINCERLSTSTRILVQGFR